MKNEPSEKSAEFLPNHFILIKCLLIICAAGLTYYHFVYRQSNVSPVITMNDLGYDNSYVEHISKNKVNTTNIYELRIANTKDKSSDEYVYFSISIYDAMTEEDAGIQFSSKIEKAVNEREKFLTKTESNSSKAILEMNKLVSEDWDSDEALSLIKFEDQTNDLYGKNILFLRKSKRYVLVEFSDGLQMTTEREQKINKLTAINYEDDKGE